MLGSLHWHPAIITPTIGGYFACWSSWHILAYLRHGFWHRVGKYILWVRKGGRSPIHMVRLEHAKPNSLSQLKVDWSGRDFLKAPWREFLGAQSSHRCPLVWIPTGYSDHSGFLVQQITQGICSGLGGIYSPLLLTNKFIIQEGTLGFFSYIINIW